MRYVVAPNAFKGTLTAPQAAQCIGRAISAFDPAAKVVALPVADGGDGTLDVLAASEGWQRIECEVTGPLDGPVRASYAWNQRRRHVCIEAAQAIGLSLVPPLLRNPMSTTSAGLGELIGESLRRAPDIVDVCVGGTASVDGGLGIASALGAEFFDEAGRRLRPPIHGRDLGLVRDWWFEPLTRAAHRSRYRFLCDVRNPLCGPEGAAAVYGPQKGATPEQVDLLDAELWRLFGEFARETGRDVRRLPGAGAGGGIGALGLLWFCERVTPGAQAILDILGLDEALQGADWVITGEGALDDQTLMGKAPAVVAARAARAKCRCAAVVGRNSLSEAKARGAGFDLVCEAGIETTGDSPEERLEAAAAQLVRKIAEAK